jgi:adenylate cyclase
MMDKLNDFNREIQTEGVPPFGMGIGINSDTVVVGNMGSDQRFDYTCLGDGVNLASRLEGQSKPYGVKIILGPKTAEMVKDEFFTLRLDCIAVKGKTEGVNIFTVLDLENTVDNNTSKAIHNLMLEFYRNRQWDKAREYTQNLVGSFNGQMDKYYLMWLERIAELEFSNLDEAWDGIYRAQSK